MGTVASQISSLMIVYSNSPGTGEFPAQMARNAENVSIWWRHHDFYWDHKAALIEPSL